MMNRASGLGRSVSAKRPARQRSRAVFLEQAGALRSRAAASEEGEEVDFLPCLLFETVDIGVPALERTEPHLPVAPNEQAKPASAVVTPDFHGYAL